MLFDRVTDGQRDDGTGKFERLDHADRKTRICKVVADIFHATFLKIIGSALALDATCARISRPIASRLATSRPAGNEGGANARLPAAIIMMTRLWIRTPTIWSYHS